MVANQVACVPARLGLTKYTAPLGSHLVGTISEIGGERFSMVEAVFVLLDSAWVKVEKKQWETEMMQELLQEQRK